MKPVVFVIMGVSGCGKSSLASYLSSLYHVSFIEGDDLHSKTAKSKMASGESLTDEDRFPWLKKLVTKCNRTLLKQNVVFLSCSSLKKSYREELRNISAEVHFIYIAISEKSSFERVSNRSEHFISPNIVASQFTTLQVPSASEPFWVKLNGQQDFNVVCEQASGYVNVVKKENLL